MINTCYDLGINIDRDITSNILNNRYNFNTVWEGDGTLVCVFYTHYNTNTLGTNFEGRCNCKKKIVMIIVKYAMERVMVMV